MSGLPSDEVAEDYKGSLEDLVTNDRYQISNLTLIAKENVEHAEAISRVLQNHINRVCHNFLFLQCQSVVSQIEPSTLPLHQCSD